MSDKETALSLSGEELDALKRLAERDGVTVDEAATALIQNEIAHRMRKNTGKAPAKIYFLRGAGK